MVFITKHSTDEACRDVISFANIQHQMKSQEIRVIPTDPEGNQTVQLLRKSALFLYH